MTAQNGNSATQKNNWQACKDQLQLQMTKATFDTWLKKTELLTVENNIYTIAVKNNKTKDTLENRLKKQIERALGNVMGDDTVKLTNIHGVGYKLELH